MTARAHKFAAIGLVACSMLMHEILLTRICALRLYFHFAFLVISNCLLGLGASGALLSIYQDDWKKSPRLSLGKFCAAYLVSLIVVYAFLLKFPLPVELSLDNTFHLLALTVYNLVGAVPFVFGGIVVGMLLTFDVEDVNRLYAVDLIGAGLGCMACPLLLPRVGAGGVFVVTALLALLATVIVLRAELGQKIVVGGAVLGVVGLAILPKLDSWVPVPSKGLIDWAHAVEKALNLGAPYSVWTANSRIDLIRPNPERVDGKFFMEGSKTAGLPIAPYCAGIAQDATAGTTLGDFTEYPETLEILKHTMYSAAYRLKDHPKVMVIGLGGGNDVWAAKINGARSVKAVELNWPIVDIHKRIYRNYSRNLVEDPTIEMVVGEGRSALMREPTKYDVIQMSGIDTWTALASGAYVLAENYLYTKEAITAMYSHLEEGGILQVARFAETMEALRLLSNMRAALASLGVPEMERSVIAMSTPDKMMAVQLKRGEFSKAEQFSVLKYADDVGVDVVYLPDRPTSDPINDFIRAKNPEVIIDAFPMNIAPTTDDCPYFFSYVKWQHPLDSYSRLGDIPSASQGNPLFILIQLVFSIALSALLILWPVSRRTDIPKDGAGRFLVYFASLGLGFVFIEVSVIQKLTLFLGQPVYSLTVTLLSLLVSTGVGSFLLGGRFAPGDRRIWVIPVGIAIYIGVFLALSSFFVTHLIGAPLPLRILLTAVALAPMGFLLGVPFAHGLRVVNAYHPALTPWAWAINGCASVVGSIVTVIISMNFGFVAVLVVAAVIYAVGFATLLRAEAKEPA